MRGFFPNLSLSCVLLLSGCSIAPVVTSTSTPPANSVPGTALTGKVHGGRNPINGAHVYLYAINNTGYGGVSDSLLNSAGNTTQDGSGNYYVTTDPNGIFNITGDYTCTNGISHLYIYTIGGDPGSGANSAAGLLASLQSCTNPGFATQFITVNEVSTIATAYALAGFAVDATHFSIPNNALAAKGMNNASLTMANLETLSTGVAVDYTPGANGGFGTVPQSEIDTLANILAACINSTGPTSSSCTTLFANAKNGSTAPTDTATAAINIAHNPGANVANLFGLQTPTSPFQPMLSAPAPNDFAISISYSGGGLLNPFGIAVDGSGNVWVTNPSVNEISEFSPTGVAITTTNGFAGGGLDSPRDIAVDAAGDVWVTNATGSRLSEFNSSGGAISTASGYTGGGLNGSYGIAIDASGNVWSANFGANSLSEFNSSGVANSSSPFTGGGLTSPRGISIDASGNIWAASAINVSELNSSGAPVSTSSGYTGGGISNNINIAIDIAGNGWTTNYSNNSLSEFSTSGTALSPATTGYTGGGLSAPTGVAVDGAGNVWVANFGGGLSEFNSSGNPVSGSGAYLGSGVHGPFSIAIDGSGNIWAPDGNGYTITEFVGAAAPVVTPMVANLKTPYGLHAVNKP